VTVDALCDRTTVTIEHTGNLSSTTDALGPTTSYQYDAVNRKTIATEAVGTSLKRTTTTAYNAIGNVCSVTDALKSTATFQRESSGARRPVGSNP
jgi:uncharacterized protein RhaS with RHS repeats